MTYAFHPIANAFPLLDGEEFAEFVASIRENGQRDSIMLFEGMILDGRNRYRACIEVGVAPRFEGLPETVDPFRYVVDKNLRRRHLTDDQRRMVAARLANLGPGRPAETPSTGRGISVETAAAIMHVDQRGVERAKEIVAKGAEELRSAVDAGDITVRAGADLARLSQEDQRAIVESGDPDAVREVVRSVRAGDIAGARSIMASRREPDDSLDFFPTPPWATRAFFERVLPMLEVGPMHQVWDPACGEGHMTAVIEEYATGITIGTDVFDYSRDGRMPPAWLRVQDFLDAKAEVPVVDWIFTNPPFGDRTGAFVLRALSLAQRGVAMFVRLQWLETIGRYEAIFRDQPPTLISFFAERVNLCKGRWEPDGSTATAYIWLTWVKGRRPLAPFWIPPGQREALTKPADRARFTAHPVAMNPTEEREDAA